MTFWSYVCCCSPIRRQFDIVSIKAIEHRTHSGCPRSTYLSYSTQLYLHSPLDIFLSILYKCIQKSDQFPLKTFSLLFTLTGSRPIYWTSSTYVYAHSNIDRYAKISRVDMGMIGRNWIPFFAQKESPKRVFYYFLFLYFPSFINFALTLDGSARILDKLLNKEKRSMLKNE